MASNTRLSLFFFRPPKAADSAVSSAFEYGPSNSSLTASILFSQSSSGSTNLSPYLKVSVFRNPGGSLDRRVNCRRVPQPRWVDTRRNAKGGKEAAGERRT